MFASTSTQRALFSARCLGHRSASTFAPGGRPFQQRFSSSMPGPSRTPIGRITPKRIAVRAPFSRSSSTNDGLPRPRIWQPIAFCVGLGGAVFVFAAMWTEAETQAAMQRIESKQWWGRGGRRGTLAADLEMQRAERLLKAKEAQETVNEYKSALSFLPNVITVPLLRLYVMEKEFRLNRPDASLVPLDIVAGMGVVWLAWQTRRLQPLMQKWFLHRPVTLGSGPMNASRNVTLLTSVFSHQSLPHFVFNSIALASFGTAAYGFIESLPPGEERVPSVTHKPHFLWFFVAAGLTSSLASHLFTNIVRLPRLLRSLNHPARLSSPQALAVNQAVLPSLGASGAIYATLTMVACAYPDTSVGLIFLPFVSVPIGLGAAGMVTLDLIGLIRGWRLFDHVAHLAGAAFGVFYYQYGRQMWWRFRKAVHEAMEMDD